MKSVTVPVKPPASKPAPSAPKAPASTSPTAAPAAAPAKPASPPKAATITSAGLGQRVMGMADEALGDHKFVLVPRSFVMPAPGVASASPAPPPAPRSWVYRNRGLLVAIAMVVLVALGLWWFSNSQSPISNPLPDLGVGQLEQKVDDLATTVGEVKKTADAAKLATDANTKALGEQAQAIEANKTAIGGVQTELNSLGTQVTDQGEKLTELNSHVDTLDAGQKVQDEEINRILEQIAKGPPNYDCNDICPHDEMSSEQPTSTPGQGESGMNKTLTAAIVAASLNLAPVATIDTATAADLPACGGNGLTRVCIDDPHTATLKVADCGNNGCGQQTGTCYIDVMVQSLGHGYPADYLTAWANGGQITNNSIRGKAKPFDGLVKIEVDCNFAYGATGQVCFGNGQDMARNLNPNWFRVAQANLARGERVLNADTPIWFTEE